MMTSVFICFEGVTGVGKSTFARKVAGQLNAAVLLDNYEANPFLSDSYLLQSDAPHLEAEISFLLLRRRQALQAKKYMESGKNVIRDYLFGRGEVFAKMRLPDRELVLFQMLDTAFSSADPRPNMVIWLDAQTDTIIRRIRNRGRFWEGELTGRDVEMLRGALREFVYSKCSRDGIRILEVDTDDVDIRDSANFYAWFNNELNWAR